MKSLFTVGGKPFLSLGGQVSNSSAYTRADLQPALDGIEALGMNTIAAPVYWECMEPEEGRFDENGVFVPHRRRNGDETDHSVWTAADVGVIHLQLL